MVMFERFGQHTLHTTIRDTETVDFDPRIEGLTPQTVKLFSTFHLETCLFGMPALACDSAAG